MKERLFFMGFELIDSTTEAPVFWKHANGAWHIFDNETETWSVMRKEMALIPIEQGIRQWGLEDSEYGTIEDFEEEYILKAI